tara:strand:- start:332 stop:565 length:234 start_codon:yes stop_codon:yes gene_type:complete
MIIPIKCVTCGEVLADKYVYYTMEVNRQKLNNNESLENIKYLDKNTTKKSVEGEVLDKLGLTKYCCRRIMLTHVDIE